MTRCKNMKIQKPCCRSVRECRVRKHYIIDVNREEILREIEATRCYRGIIEYYEVEPNQNVAILEHYVSNRGVNYIRFIFKPEGITEDVLMSKVRRALGLETIEKIVLK
jgi:hypothetical protein